MASALFRVCSVAGAGDCTAATLRRWRMNKQGTERTDVVSGLLSALQGPVGDEPAAAFRPKWLITEPPVTSVVPRQPLDLSRCRFPH
jgi:hypothetical protein